MTPARSLAAIDTQIASAVGTDDRDEQARRMTVVIGGGGATGVELAGELAEELPEIARRHGLDPTLSRVILIDAGPTILVGSSPGLIERASEILRDLGVEVRTNSLIARATKDGFVLKSGDTIRGGVFVWAGGVKAPELVSGSGLQVGANGRVKVDQYLRALDRPEIYVRGRPRLRHRSRDRAGLPADRPARVGRGGDGRHQTSSPRSRAERANRSSTTAKDWSSRSGRTPASPTWPGARSAVASPIC